MGKPQDLPIGEAQMRVGIVFAFVTYVIAMAVPYGLFTASLQAIVDLLGTALILWVALRQTNRLPRMHQAFGGLCGASAFINLASLPMTMFSQSSGGVLAGGLAGFVLLVWGLSLIGYILRHTFEIKMIVSILIAYFYIVIWGGVVNTLVPVSVRETVSLAAPEFSNVFLNLPGSELLIVSYVC